MQPQQFLLMTPTNRKTDINKCKILWLISLCVVISAFCSGCDSIFNREKFDKNLLSGYWISGTLHEYYNADGTGYTWDTADDVNEDEAQRFTWKLENTTLTQLHQMEMGGVIPKTYTVTKLSATNLNYHDDYGKYYSFIKEK